MATKRLPMKDIREILRLKWVQGLSHRKIGRSLGVSAGSVGSVVKRSAQKGIDWEAVAKLDDDELEQVLYGPKLRPGEARPLPEATWMHVELRRTGVTLELLHLEYLEKHPRRVPLHRILRPL